MARLLFEEEGFGRRLEAGFRVEPVAPLAAAAPDGAHVVDADAADGAPGAEPVEAGAPVFAIGEDGFVASPARLDVEAAVVAAVVEDDVDVFGASGRDERAHSREAGPVHRFAFGGELAHPLFPVEEARAFRIEDVDAA